MLKNHSCLPTLVAWLSVQSNHTVRLKAAGRYASGLLVTESLVDAALAGRFEHDARVVRPPAEQKAGFILTAAHFLRGPAGGGRVWVRGESFSATAQEHVSVFGTDIAVLKLQGRAPGMSLPGIASGLLSPGQLTLTYGFGGRSTEKVPKELRGRALFRVPCALSRNAFTRVRHGVVIINTPEPAVRGDSGGPVLAGGQVYGLQSMISDPFGVNTRVATVASIAPHLPAIRRAMEQLW